MEYWPIDLTPFGIYVPISIGKIHAKDRCNSLVLYEFNGEKCLISTQMERVGGRDYTREEYLEKYCTEKDGKWYFDEDYFTISAKESIQRQIDRHLANLNSNIELQTLGEYFVSNFCGIPGYAYGKNEIILFCQDVDFWNSIDFSGYLEKNIKILVHDEPEEQHIVLQEQSSWLCRIL